jgi:O-antigen ligase
MAVAVAIAPLYDAFSPSGPSFRLHLGFLPTTWLEIALVLALAVGLVAGWGRLPWRNPYTWPALVLLAGAVLDTWFTPDHRAALGILKAYFIEPMLAGVVIAWLAADRRQARLLLGGLAIAGLISATANLGAVADGLRQHQDVVHVPPVLLYRTANAVPLFLVPLDAFALAIALYGDVPRERVVAWIFLAVTVPASVLSLSRAGWAALAVVIVLIGLFHRRRVLLIGVPALAAAILAAALPGARERIGVEFDLANRFNSVSLRFSLWRSALNMLLHQPLFGGGLAGFRRSLQPYQERDYGEQQIYPHNLFLNFWSETGLVGLVGFLWTAVQVLRTALGGLAATPWARTLSIGLLAALAAIFVHGQVDVPYFKNDLALEFWTLLGIQFGALRAANGIDSQP